MLLETQMCKLALAVCDKWILEHVYENALGPFSFLKVMP